MAHKIPKLQYWAEKYAKMYWNELIEHPVIWKTLKSEWGSVIYKVSSQTNKITLLRIQMSTDTYMDKEGEFHGTLKHELCHYFLLKKGIIHGETSKVFTDELRRTGGTMPYITEYWKFHCLNCQLFVMDAKRFNRKKFLELKKCNCEYTGYTKHSVGARMT